MKFKLQKTVSTFLMPTVECCICHEKTSMSYQGLCVHCLEDLKKLRDTYAMCNFCGSYYLRQITSCPHCFLKREPKSYLLVESCYPYRDIAKELLRIFKFRNGRYLAPTLVKLMTECYDFGEEGRYDGIIAVPMTKKKQRERGYNQCEVLAKELSMVLEIPFFKGALLKIRETDTQSSLSKSQRRENVRGAYAANEKVFLQGKSLLLLDDVITTGETANECSRMLKRSGVKQIKVCTLCGASGVNEKAPV